MSSERSVLFVCNYNGQKRNFLFPLAQGVESVTIVAHDDKPKHDQFEYVTFKNTGYRILNIFILFFVSIRESLKNEYDLIASISLIPYGMFVVVAGIVSRTPTHLAIIGGDLDVHAQSSYKPVVVKFFDAFSVISVTAEKYTHQLRELGVNSPEVVVLTNSIPLDKYTKSADGEIVYDFIWVAKFNEVKQPSLFVDALAELNKKGVSFSAVMCGSGERMDLVKESIDEHGLEENITLAGWVENPAEYLHKSNCFVLTSERDALPFALLEAMAAGLVCVVPDVGGISELIKHGQNGLLYHEHDPETISEMLEKVKQSEGTAGMGKKAATAAQEYGYQEAAQDWQDIVEKAQVSRDEYSKN